MHFVAGCDIMPRRWLEGAMLPMYTLMVLAAVVLLVGEFCISKYYQKNYGVTLCAGLTYTFLNAVLTAVLFWAISGFGVFFSLFSLLLAAGMGLCNLCYALLGFRIMAHGQMALYTLFLMTGGMTLPYLYGLFFLNEPFSLLRTVGLLLIVVAVVLSSGAKTGAVPKVVLTLCLGVFVCNGMVSIFSKVHQIDTTHAAVTSAQFVCLTALCRACFSGVALLFCRGKGAPSPAVSYSTAKAAPTRRPPAPRLLLAGFSACLGGVSYLLQLTGAQHLPATVLYPLITGGSIAFTTLAALWLFHEKPGKGLLVGVGLCILGTCCFL